MGDNLPQLHWHGARGAGGDGMWFIQHRVNSSAGLAALPRVFGAEIDVRYHCDELVLEHDPFHHHRSSPERLADWLKGWRHAGPLILNLKSEGIERAAIELMQRHQVRNWFFLDLSAPFLVKYSLHAARREIDGLGPENIAVRFSEHEPIEAALAFAGRAGWVWVDCFSRLPLDADNARRLRQAGFRLCIVSPELQHHPVDWIAAFRATLVETGADAVCSKRPDLWSAASEAA